MRVAADLVNTKGHPSGNDYMDTPQKAREFFEHGFSGADDVLEADVAELHAVGARLEEVFYMRSTTRRPPRCSTGCSTISTSSPT